MAAPISSALAALLLAGGDSQRMGRPKINLSWQGRPLWQLQSATLEQLAPAERLFSLPPGFASPATGWQLIRDPHPGLGPLAGIAEAFRQTSSPWLAVLAIDLPRMPAAYLAGLWAQAQTLQQGIVPELDGWAQGTAAIYPRTLVPLVESVLATADRSIQHLIARALAQRLVSLRPVLDQEKAYFLNWNSPEDLAPTQSGAGKSPIVAEM